MTDTVNMVYEKLDSFLNVNKNVKNVKLSEYTSMNLMPFVFKVQLHGGESRDVNNYILTDRIRIFL